MNQSKISVRYTKALFDLAKEQNLLDKVYQDFRIIRETLANVPEFKTITASPIVSSSDKLELMTKSFADVVCPLTIDFFKFLVSKNRESFIIDIMRNFEKMYRDANNLKEVTLSTVEPISEGIKQELATRIKEIYSSDVEIHNEINSDMIGGLVLRIENQQLDLSVKTQLQEIKKSLGREI